MRVAEIDTRSWSQWGVYKLIQPSLWWVLVWCIWYINPLVCSFFVFSGRMDSDLSTMIIHSWRYTSSNGYSIMYEKVWYCVLFYNLLQNNCIKRYQKKSCPQYTIDIIPGDYISDMIECESMPENIMADNDIVSWVRAIKHTYVCAWDRACFTKSWKIQLFCHKIFLWFVRALSHGEGLGRSHKWDDWVRYQSLVDKSCGTPWVK